MNYPPGGFNQPQPNQPQPGAAPVQIPGPQPAPIYTPNAPVNPQNPTYPAQPGAANPAVPPVPYPGQPGAPAVDPNAPPVTAPPPVNYQKRYDDQQRYVTQLEQEKLVSYETIEAQTQKIGDLEGRISRINTEIERQMKNVSNPNLSEHNQRIAFDMLRDLRTDRDKFNTELQTVAQQNEQAVQQVTQYQQNLQRAEYAKSFTFENEMSGLMQDPEMLQVFGNDPVQLVNFVNQQVVTATQNNPVAKQAYVDYLQNRIDLKGLVNVVLEPQRRLYQTAFQKRAANVGGAIPGTGHSPQPQQPQRAPGVNRFFSINSNRHRS